MPDDLDDDPMFALVRGARPELPRSFEDAVLARLTPSRPRPRGPILVAAALSVAVVLCAVVLVHGPSPAIPAPDPHEAVRPATPAGDPAPSTAAIRQVVASSLHTCALHVDGNVSCWGGNRQQQLATADSRARLAPIGVPAIRNAIELSASEGGTCALRADGLVQCWGTPPAAFVLATQVDHAIHLRGSCALISNGTVRCRPAGSTSGASSTPWQAIAGIADAIDADGALDYGCAVHGDHRVTCWSRSQTAEIRALADAIQVRISGHDACVLRQNGRVQCWQAMTAPLRAARPVDVTGLDDVISLSTRCAARGAGDVRCWSSPPDASAYRAAPVAGLRDIASLSTSERHGCAVPRAGARAVYCWGANTDGQLGNGAPDEEPATLPDSGPATAVHLTARDEVAVLRDGRVACATGARCAATVSAVQQISELDGRMTFLDRAGRAWVDGEAAARKLPEATRLAGLCVVTVQRQVWCDSLDRRRAPHRVSGIDDAVDVAVAAGGDVLIRRASGRVALASARGELDRSGLSDGLATIDDAVAVTLGDTVACVVRAAHPLWCSDRLPRGLVEKPLRDPPAGILDPYEHGGSIPKAMAGVTNITALAMSDAGRYACALTRAGQVICWGNNDRGQLGGGTQASTRAAVTVRNVREAIAVATGPRRACAVERTGAVVCWGDPDLAKAPAPHVEAAVQVAWPP